MDNELYPFLEKQGWIVKDWTGVTDTQVLNWIEENVEDIGTYGTEAGNYMVIRWTVVDAENDRVHTFATHGENLRDCVANARLGLSTEEVFD